MTLHAIEEHSVGVMSICCVTTTKLSCNYYTIVLLFSCSLAYCGHILFIKIYKRGGTRYGNTIRILSLQFLAKKYM